MSEIPSAAGCHEDLSSEEGCRGTVEFALERYGRLDVVVQTPGVVFLASDRCTFAGMVLV